MTIGTDSMLEVGHYKNRSYNRNKQNFRGKSNLETIGVEVNIGGDRRIFKERDRSHNRGSNRVANNGGRSWRSIGQN